MTGPVLRNFERPIRGQFLEGTKRTINFWKKFGVFEGIRRLRQTKEIVDGELRGTDEFGNQYYEDLRRAPNQQRYIIYSGARKHVDASRIPSRWHHWMCYITDETPDQQKPVPGRYITQHSMNNLSNMGSQAAYQPKGAFLRHEPRGNATYDIWSKEPEEIQKIDRESTQPRV